MFPDVEDIEETYTFSIPDGCMVIPNRVGSFVPIGGFYQLLRPTKFKVGASYFSIDRISFEAGRGGTFVGAVKRLFLSLASVLSLAGALFAQVVSSPEVPYPDGYREWRHITSGILPPKQGEANSHPNEAKAAAPHGLIHHIYANEKALEGYRTGHFPEGAVLIADWFVLEETRGALHHGPRHSIDVMIRDARYRDTGGWGFEKFDKDSRTTRTVGPNAVKSCFECHTAAEDREYVFSVLKP